MTRALALFGVLLCLGFGWPPIGPGVTVPGGGPPSGGPSIFFSESFEPSPEADPCGVGGSDNPLVESIPDGGAVTCDATDVVAAGTQSAKITGGTTSGSLIASIDPAGIASGTFCASSALQVSNTSDFAFSGNSLVAVGAWAFQVRPNARARLRCPGINSPEFDFPSASEVFTFSMEGDLGAGTGSFWIDGVLVATCDGTDNAAAPTNFSVFNNSVWASDIWADEVTVGDGACGL